MLTRASPYNRCLLNAYASSDYSQKTNKSHKPKSDISLVAQQRLQFKNDQEQAYIQRKPFEATHYTDFFDLIERVVGYGTIHPMVIIKHTSGFIEEWLEKNPESEHPEAIFEFGRHILRWGEDYHGFAFTQFTLAACKGNIKGNVGRGLCFEFGLGVRTDFEKALENYKKAVELDFMYVEGFGIIRVTEVICRVEEKIKSSRE